MVTLLSAFPFPSRPSPDMGTDWEVPISCDFDALNIPRRFLPRMRLLQSGLKGSESPQTLSLLRSRLPLDATSTRGVDFSGWPSHHLAPFDIDGNVRQSDEAERYLPERIPSAATRTSENTLVQAAETVARRCHEAVRPAQARRYTNAATVRKRNEGRNKVNNLVRPQEEQDLRRWAEENGLMLGSEEFDRRWREQRERGEAEHRLYFDQAVQRWFKSNNLSNYGNWMAYFQANCTIGFFRQLRSSSKVLSTRGRIFGHWSPSRISERFGAPPNPRSMR